MKDINSKKKHVTDFFANLDFNSEQHSYNYRDRTLSSVSSIIKKFSEPFDADKIAFFVARKRGISKEEVLQEWEDKKNNACNRGNQAHSFGETYSKGDTATNGFEQAIINFWDSIPDHVIPFLFELKMFSELFGIAGTCDILLYNTKTGKFIIVDYKTNEDLFKNYKGKKMLEPFKDLIDSPYNKYQIQLSLYQLLFEQCGFKVESRRIVWLKPDGSFEMYKTKNLVSRVKKELKSRL